MRVEDIEVVRHTEPPRLPASFSWVGRLATSPRDQGTCGSCYALAATQVAEDRMHLHGAAVPHLDYMKVADQPDRCVYYKGRVGCIEGCAGGFVLAALDHLHKVGAPAVGDADGRHYKTAGLYSVSGAAHPDLYGVVSAQDPMPPLDAAQRAANADNIARDILQNGPVCATFLMYSDFVDYVLERPQGDEPYYVGWRQGRELGPPEGDQRWGADNPVQFETAHAVAIVGWGVSPRGTPYWVVRNSWGQGGYVHVERGRNVAAIESSIEAPKVAGTPPLANASRHGGGAGDADVAITVSVLAFVFLLVLLLGARKIWVQ